MIILVDTNILLDIATQNPLFVEKSLHALEDAASSGTIAINAIVYAEFSTGYNDTAEVDRFMRIAGLEMLDIPKQALFQAGKAFLRYRRMGGSRTGVLPDFFIGAHAETAGLPLLTRDVKRMRTYFPDVRLVTP